MEYSVMMSLTTINIATKIVRQPLLTLTMQLNAYADTSENSESKSNLLLQMLVQTMQRQVVGVTSETIFHATGPELMQLIADTLNFEHDLMLKSEDLERAFSSRGLAHILYAQMQTYG